MKVIGVMIALAAALGCGESPVAPSELTGGTWRLVLIERAGATAIPVPDPARYTIQFLESERMSMRADCNTCSGSYGLKGTALSVGALACTRAFCGDASLDSQFLPALGSARSLTFESSRLLIRADSATLQFRND